MIIKLSARLSRSEASVIHNDDGSIHVSLYGQSGFLTEDDVRNISRLIDVYYHLNASYIEAARLNRKI